MGDTIHFLRKRHRALLGAQWMTLLQFQADSTYLFFLFIFSPVVDWDELVHNGMN